jgi:hypothetical protein
MGFGGAGGAAGSGTALAGADGNAPGGADIVGMPGCKVGAADAACAGGVGAIIVAVGATVAAEVGSVVGVTVGVAVGDAVGSAAMTRAPRATPNIAVARIATAQMDWRGLRARNKNGTGLLPTACRRAPLPEKR